jgi:ABC-type glycerol-3-phosphate transport system permease component
MKAPKMKSRKLRLLDVIWLIVAVMFLVFVFFPILWMVLCSLRPNVEVFAFPPRLIPSKTTLEAFRAIFLDRNFLRSLFNAFLVCSITTLFCLAMSTLAAYGFTRYEFRGKGILQQYLLTTQMIPIILLALPFFVILTRMRLYDTRLGLILAYTSFTLPFCSLTMIGFFRSIPEELDESALIDGCSRLGAFFRVIMPLTLPGLVATGIFAFIYSWNEYLMAVVLTSSGRTRMLTVFIGSKIGQYNTIWNELMAITVAASAPLVVIYTLLQRFFRRGITTGALKM